MTAFRRPLYRLGLLTIMAVMPLGLAAEAEPEADVIIKGFAFTPQTLKISAGTTVTWVNRDDEPHTVISGEAKFRSDALDTGDKFSFTFVTPGTYTYFCTLHPHMTGTVEVARATDAR
jgi:plastocyanin